MEESLQRSKELNWTSVKAENIEKICQTIRKSITLLVSESSRPYELLARRCRQPIQRLLPDDEDIDHLLLYLIDNQIESIYEPEDDFESSNFDLEQYIALDIDELDTRIALIYVEFDRRLAEEYMKTHDIKDLKEACGMIYSDRC